METTPSKNIDPDQWLEVSLVVPGEEAEAVAEVLARFAPDGVVIEATQISQAEDAEHGQAVGPLRVCAYLAVNAGLEETRRRLEEALWYLGRIRPLPAPEYRALANVDWTESWKQHYHPVAIGARLAIIPAWLEPPDRQRISVRIDPGMAFGTGTHPTTQLCLELLENELPTLSALPGGWEVIDVGCGSGILSIAALKLGARQALGVDIDPAALENARRNAALNAVGPDLELGQGSVDEVLDGEYGLRRAPLVFANILAPVIIRLLREGLAELVQPGGRLVLSGILDEQSEAVCAALVEQGLQLLEQRQQGDWVAYMTGV